MSKSKAFYKDIIEAACKLFDDRGVVRRDGRPYSGHIRNAVAKKG